MNEKELPSVDGGKSEGKPPNAKAKKAKLITGFSTAIRIASTLAYVGAAINLLLGVATMLSKSPATLVFFFKAVMMLQIGKGLRTEDKLYAWLSVIFSGIFAVVGFVGIFFWHNPAVSIDMIFLWIATVIVCIKWKEFS